QDRKSAPATVPARPDSSGRSADANVARVRDPGYAERNASLAEPGPSPTSREAPGLAGPVPGELPLPGASRCPAQWRRPPGLSPATPQCGDELAACRAALAGPAGLRRGGARPGS